MLFKEQSVLSVNVVLYCTVLYCTVLYCAALRCAVLYCTVLCCAVLYCTVQSLCGSMLQQVVQLLTARFDACKGTR